MSRFRAAFPFVGLVYIVTTVNVYIDGFNLYNGAVRGTTYKWLDVEKMCITLLPRLKVKRVHYFTARVSGFRHDPDAPLRQDVYVRALRTLSAVQVHANGWLAPMQYGFRVIPFLILIHTARQRRSG